jgi:hypothetical protein
LTSVAPRYTDVGDIVAFTMPSSENLTSDRGDAAQASEIASRRFLRTRCARLEAMDADVCGDVAGCDWTSKSIAMFAG